MSKYRMVRKGTFVPENHTSNQCGFVGVTDYTYSIQILLAPKLDEQGFCINHSITDEEIQNSCIEGSCEQMQKQIYKIVKKVCNKNKVKFYAYSCTIIPLHESKEVLANITYLKGKKKYLNLLN